MVQRSMYAGQTPQVIIRSGKDIVVRGWDSDRLLADTSERWGIKIKHSNEIYEVQVGGTGQVLVPHNSHVTVYSGKSAQIQQIDGSLSAVAGTDLFIQQVNLLNQATAGKMLEIDCKQVGGTAVVFTAGQNLRCRVRDDGNIHFVVDDMGGRWETILGAGSIQITLKAGGGVTLITEKEVIGMPPYYILGAVEPPASD